MTLRPYVLYLIAALTILYALIAGHERANPSWPDIPAQKHVYQAFVTDVSTTASGQTFTARVNIPYGAQRYFNARINASIDPRITVGDSITVSAAMRQPHNDTAPDTFDYIGYLHLRDITAVARADSIHITGQASSLYWRIRRLQPLIGDILRKSSISDGACQFLTTALVGDDSYMPDTTRQIFSSGGLAHILALSGLHVGIVAIVIAIALFPLWLMRRRKALSVITVLMLWLYVIVTGLSPSVVRAVIMATCLAGAQLLERRYASMHALLLAAIIILAVDPVQLFMPGFQMSFAAVAAIIIFYPLVTGPWLYRISSRPFRWILIWLVSSALVSVIATISSGIIALYWFHSFPTLFLFANIPVLALLPFLMGAGICLIICGSLGFDPLWLCRMIDKMYYIIFYIANSISGLSSDITGIYISPWPLLPYFLALISVAAILRYRRHIWPYVSFALCAIAAIFTFAASVTNSGDIPESEFFFPYSSRHLVIVARHGSHAVISTSAPPLAADNIVENIRHAHHDFFARRGVTSFIRFDINSLRTVHDPAARMRLLGRNIRILDRTDTLYPVLPDTIRYRYLIIERGFRGDIMPYIKAIDADTVLLASGLHPAVHTRAADSLRTHGIAFVSLRHDALHRICATQ